MNMKAADLVGAWHLEDFVLRRGSEESRPFGHRPTGRLHILATGELLVSVLAEGRSRCSSDDMQESSVAEATAAFRGAVSYFGDWRFDPEESALFTAVRGSLFPNWEGTIQKRLVELKGCNELTLTTPPVPWDGQAQQGILRWSKCREAAVGTTD